MTNDSKSSETSLVSIKTNSTGNKMVLNRTISTHLFSTEYDRITESSFFLRSFTISEQLAYINDNESEGMVKDTLIDRTCFNALVSDI